MLRLARLQRETHVILKIIIMSGIAIYTCVTGGYDDLKQPLAPAPEGFDFIQFVPKGEKTQDYKGVWKVEELPVSWDDPIITSRFPKLSPQTVLEDYEYSLWIDGNVRIADRRVYQRCLELMEREVMYAGIKHPGRDCVYEECERVLKDDRESFRRLVKIVRYLRKNGLPRHAGLMENNVIFRRHNHPAVVEFDRLWMERFAEYSPRRDQLVHSLCLKDVPEMEYEYFLPEGQTAMNSPLFEYTRHPAPELTYLQRKWKYGRHNPERWLLHLYLQLIPISQ